MVIYPGASAYWISGAAWIILFQRKENIPSHYMCARVYVYVTYVITFVAFQTSFVQKNCIVVVSSLDISSYVISLY